jgi:excisionase family DNA binding protein
MTPTETPTENWRSKATLTIPECARILGLTRSAAYDAARDGHLPCIRIGKRIRVLSAPLARMIDPAA